MTTHPVPQPQASRRLRRPAAAFVLAAIGLVLLAGCGSSSSSNSGSTAETTASTPSSSSTPAASTPSESESAGSRALKLEAASGGQLEYNTKSLSAKAGKVSIDFTNNSPVGHNVTIESSSGETVGSTPTFTGGSKTLTANLKPGTYKFYCSVPGHRQAGMEGTITVK